MKRSPLLALRRGAGLLLAAGLVSAAGGCGAPQPSGEVWTHKSLSAAQAEAQLAEEPLLVLVCPADGEGEVAEACLPLLRESETPEMQERLKGVLALALVATAPDARRLIRLHSVGKLPSLLLFSAGGDLLLQRDGARDFAVLQPFPDRPAPIAEIASYQFARLEEYRSSQRTASEIPTDPEAAIAMAMKAVDSRNFERAGEILGRLPVAALNLRQLVDAGDTAEKAERPDLAAEFWQRMLHEYPNIEARAQALDRFARCLVASGQSPRLEQYVFGSMSLRSQWEYLTVATAASSGGDARLARQIANQGLSRYPDGPHAEALRFLVGETAGE